jgi:hypothetical protein
LRTTRRGTPLVRLGGTADQITLEEVQAAALGRVDFSVAQELHACAGLRAKNAIGELGDELGKDRVLVGASGRMDADPSLVASYDQAMLA